MVGLYNERPYFCHSTLIKTTGPSTGRLNCSAVGAIETLCWMRLGNCLVLMMTEVSSTNFPSPANCNVHAYLQAVGMIL